MNQINLLPYKLKRKEDAQRLVSAMLVAGVLGVILVGVAWWSLKLEVSTLKTETVRVQGFSQNKEVAPATSTLDQDTITRVALLNTLAQNDVNWPRAFSLITTILPEDIHLTSYTLSSAKGVVSLKIGGEAPTNLSFAVFVKSLQQNKDLTNVKVNAYNFEVARGTVSFSLDSPIAPAALDYSTK